ncbi:MAG TPA: hypothetical protein VIL71_09520 [Spirillospora sp.]
MLTVLGLSILAGGLFAAADPYRQTRQFREVVACEHSVGNCFTREQSSIVDRRTWVTTNTDSDGHTTTTTHYEITWRRADGSRESREVMPNFYEKARPGEPAVLRIWRQEVVAVEVRGGTKWFLPAPGRLLGFWLFVAYFGFGVLLRGLLVSRRPGWVTLIFGSIGWLLLGSGPVLVTTAALAYGLSMEAILDDLVFGVFAAVVGGIFLINSFEFEKW